MPTQPVSPAGNTQVEKKMKAMFGGEPKTPVQAVHADCYKLVDPRAELKWLDTDLGGEASDIGYPWMPAEGPVWFHDAGYLLLSDIGKKQRMKWSPQEGMKIDLTNSNSANGMTRDLQGRLVICEHMTQRVVRRELDGTVTVLADKYKGKRLSRPNDVVVKSDGAIYFTDPDKPIFTKVEQDFAAVYRLSPDGKTLDLLCSDLVAPNGLCFSPGETTLYINDTHAAAIYAYDVEDNGLIGARRTFAILKDERSGLVDGMKVDLEGNLYCTGPGGVWIMAPDGRHLGTIALGEGRRATNLAWGDQDWRTLYITTTRELCSIRMKVRGTPVPVKLIP
jgi:gluconolactonase